MRMNDILEQMQRYKRIHMDLWREHAKIQDDLIKAKKSNRKVFINIEGDDDLRAIDIPIQDAEALLLLIDESYNEDIEKYEEKIKELSQQLIELQY